MAIASNTKSTILPLNLFFILVFLII